MRLQKELPQICGGEVKKWPAANRPGKPIHGYGLQPTDAAMKMFLEMAA